MKDLTKSSTPCNSVILSGELVWRDTAAGVVKSAAVFPWDTDLATTRAAFSQVCVGVATDDSTSTTVEVNKTTACGHDFACDALTTYIVGDPLGPVQGPGNTLSSTEVEKVGESEGCARVAEWDPDQPDVVVAAVGSKAASGPPSQLVSLAGSAPPVGLGDTAVDYEVAMQDSVASGVNSVSEVDMSSRIESGFRAVGVKFKEIAPPPVDLFTPGWAEYKWDDFSALMAVGSVHAACSFGNQTPTVAGIAFEQSNTQTNDKSVTSGAGWSGTNWQVQRAGEAPVPPTEGSNTATTEVTAFSDMPDPSWGEVAGMSDFTDTSLRRNSYITISGLTSGQRYYYYAFFGTYPDVKTRFTRIPPSDGGPSVSFAIDASGLIWGIKRYGFTASAASISFLKWGYDSNGSYQNGFCCHHIS